MLIGSYTETLTNKIVDNLKQNGVEFPWLPNLIRTNVKTVLTEIQHRLYQDVLANGCDLAKQLYPAGERKS